MDIRLQIEHSVSELARLMVALDFSNTKAERSDIIVDLEEVIQAIQALDKEAGE